MKVAVAHSLDPDTAEAAEELIAAITERLGGAIPSAGLLYAAMDLDHALLVSQIQDAFPDVQLIGCSTDGELSDDQGFHEDSTVLVLFASDQVQIRAGLGRNVGDDPTAAVQQALQMARLPGDLPPRLCIALPDGLSVSGTVVAHQLQEALGAGVSVVGGSAADQCHFRSCRLFFGREVLEDAVPLLLLGGPLQIGVGVASGWEPVGPTATVTASAGNLVERIDDTTAVDFYRRYLGEHVIPAIEHPLALHKNGRFSLRAPLFIDEERGTLQFAGDVPVGAVVQITEATQDDILQACASSVQAASDDLGRYTPDGMLVFSCASRRIVLGTQTPRELQILQANSTTHPPTAGFYTYGEITPPARGEPTCFHNEAFVTLLLAEA